MAAVNALLLRTGQGYPEMAQERENGRKGNERATVQKTTAVMKQTRSLREQG